MKRLAPHLIGSLIGFALITGCSPSAPDTSNSTAHQAAPEPAPPTAAPAKAVKAEESGPALTFTYAYPAEAAAIPNVDQWLKSDLAKTKAEAAKGAAEDKAEMDKEGFPFRPHDATTNWTVGADGPRFLSLIGEDYVYTGGAHGMTGYRGLLWDRQAERVVPVTSLFTSVPAFVAVVRGEFCKDLNAERAEKRGTPVDSASEDEFDKCVDIPDQTLIPVGQKGRPINAIRVVIGPYAAGPYAEGNYEIDLDVTPAMLKAIKPEYQDGFKSN